MKTSKFLGVRILTLLTLAACGPLSTQVAKAGNGCDNACDNACAATACDSLPSNFNCNGGGCGSCDGCRCDARQWYLGVEATFLAPLYDNGPADFTLIDVPGASGAILGSTYDQADELTGAPRITLGWGGRDGIGIQARYWELDNSASAFAFPPTIVPALNQAQELGGVDSFNAYTIDLELTKEFDRGRWDLLGTFGVRYAEYDRSRSNSVFGVVNDDVFALSSLQGNAFHGTGLTSSLAGLRPLKSHPCMALYASVRGSAVFGDASTSAVSSSTFSGPGGSAGSTNGAIGFDDETLFITELQAGLQWSRNVRSFNGRMFARAGFEYQFWTVDDQTAIATSASGTPGISFGSTAVTGAENDFDLIGFTIGTGFAW